MVHAIEPLSERHLNHYPPRHRDFRVLGMRQGHTASAHALSRAVVTMPCPAGIAKHFASATLDMQKVFTRQVTQHSPLIGSTHASCYQPMKRLQKLQL